MDRLFTYLIPEDMSLKAGHRVHVPFGATVQEGYVLSLHENTELSSSIIKPVLSVIDEDPVLLPQIIALAKYVQESCYCTLCAALRLMLPAQMRKGRVRPLTRLAVKTKLTDEDFERIKEKNKRAIRQMEAFRLLLDKGGDMLLNTLEEDLPQAHALFSALAKKGIVTLYKKEVIRQPSYTQDQVDQLVTPNTEQRYAIDQVCTSLGQGKTFLLHGVTGSGKTEVYLHIINEVLRLGKKAIVLVPEISLTPQMVGWFRARFGTQAAVLHSRLSAGERFDEWRRLQSGEAMVAIGARSCIFAPVDNLGIIIIDEEHEASYHAEGTPSYDTREIARFRCENENACLLLGSATPSLESYARAINGTYTLLEMQKRATGNPLAHVKIVDMRTELLNGNRSMFSNELQKQLRLALSRDEQVMLFLNRRGYASFVSCRACGTSIKCPHCDVTLTYHSFDQSLKCHYCGYQTTMPKHCPSCGSQYIRQFGTGTQKVEEAFLQLFPQAKVLRMDYDTTQTKDAHMKILSAFRNREAQVLIGTQMIAKGHDFPLVTLVGVLSADLSLQNNDYRAEERTFQLLVQVSGRAGRGHLPGNVILQTYTPEHYAIQLGAKQDYRAFYHTEIRRRQRAQYPPFTYVTRLLFSGRKKENVQDTAAQAEEKIQTFFLAHPQAKEQVVQMRMMEAPLSFLKDVYRYQLYIKWFSTPQAERAIFQMARLEKELRNDTVQCKLEINPSSIL